jgi:outer membrane lipoprotein-sorting protein
MTDPLDAAIGALRAAPVPQLPADLVTDVTSRLPAEPARASRRKKLMRYARYGAATAAAVALSVAAGLLWPAETSAAAHVHKALDNAAKAKSVKVTARLVNAEVPGKMTHIQTMFRQDDMLRIETVWAPPEVPDKPVTVADLMTRQSLTLLPGLKTATRSTLGVEESRGLAAVMGDFAGMTARLTGGDDKAVKAVGGEQIGGRRTKAYEITVKEPKVAHPGVWTVWVDPETELPVRLADSQRALVLDFEDWNKDFDPKLFTLDVPAGYTLTEPPAPPAESPLVLLRRAADKAAKAKSVRLVFTREYEGKSEPMMTVHIRDGRSRWDDRRPGKDGTLIVDTAARTVLELNHKDMTATRKTLEGAAARDAGDYHAVFFDPLKVLRQTKDMTVKELGGEKLGGRAMRVYMCSHPGNQEHAAMTGVLWVDEKTNLPARLKLLQDGVVTEGRKPPYPRADTVIAFEDWDKEFDPKLFAQDVPAGYKVVEEPVEK